MGRVHGDQFRVLEVNMKFLVLLTVACSAFAEADPEPQNLIGYPGAGYGAAYLAGPGYAGIHGYGRAYGYAGLSNYGYPGYGGYAQAPLLTNGYNGYNGYNRFALPSAAAHYSYPGLAGVYGG